jgi:hypothetical protein
MAKGIKEIRISLTKAEHNKLIQAKGSMTWHDYLTRDIYKEKEK